MEKFLIYFAAFLVVGAGMSYFQRGNINLTHGGAVLGRLIESNGYGRTIVETLLLGLVMVGLVAGLDYLGFTVGNSAGVSGKIDLTPSQIAMLVIVGPLLEELIFRGPAWFARKVNIYGYWVIGLICTTAFAAVHGLALLPVPQFILGLYFWYLVRARGFSHNLLAHMVLNGSMVILLWAERSVFI